MIACLDAYSLLFRAHHALPPMSTTTGEPTSALYGFTALLLKVLREERPEGLAVAFDAPVRTFRHDRFEGYKSGRERAPSPLVQQIRRLDGLVAALGVPVLRVPGFEADDVLATLARSLGSRALVVSGDTDVLQATAHGATVLFVGARGQKATRYDAAAVEARYGVPPGSLPSWQALVGDASDTLPGVRGIGPKTAAALVRTHGDVAGILAHLDALSPKVRAALAAAPDLAVMEDLARLRDDLALPEPSWAPLGDLSTFRAALESLEFKSLLPRLDAL